MSSKYTKQHFVTKFSAHPDDLWWSGSYRNPYNAHQQCAQAQCGMDAGVFTAEGRALSDLLGCSPADINDGKDIRYQEETPRARILAALNEVPE